MRIFISDGTIHLVAELGSVVEMRNYLLLAISMIIAVLSVDLTDLSISYRTLAYSLFPFLIVTTVLIQKQKDIAHKALDNLLQDMCFGGDASS